MRVKKPAEKIRITFKDDEGHILTSYKKKIVTPGEMVSVYLPEVFLEDRLKDITSSIEKETKE